MLAKIIRIWILFILLVPSALIGQTDDTLSLSLKECILKTVQNNLGLAVERITPEIADASALYASEKFIPTLSMDYGKQDSNSAS